MTKLVKFYKAVEQMYLLPMLLKAIDYKVWEVEARSKSPRCAMLYKVLVDKGYIDNGIPNTELRELIILRDLIAYNCEMVQHHLQDNMVDNAIISRSTRQDANYNTLRSGLAAYFKLYMSNLFDDLGLVDMDTCGVADLGGGIGTYGAQFVRRNPKTICTVIDKDENVSTRLIDSALYFSKQDITKYHWYDGVTSNYKVAILAEILHCLGRSQREQVFTGACDMILNGGYVLVVEKKPMWWFDWRMKLFTDGGEALDEDEIKGMGMRANGLITLKRVKRYENHIAYLFKKR